MNDIYSEERHFKEAIANEEVLTPVPETLTVRWDDGYYFDEVYDGSSLIWIWLIIETFCEAYPGVDWSVDDPGTLYDQGSLEDHKEPPYSLEKMQEVSQVALARYSSLFNRLRAAGMEVEEA